MDLVYPNEALGNSVAKWLSGGLTYHLFSNNLTITTATVLTDFIEPTGTWSGYAAIAVAAADFGSPTFSAGVCTAAAAAVTFVLGSGNSGSAYGYFVTYASGSLAFAARFSAPISVTSPVNIPVTPTILSNSKVI